MSVAYGQACNGTGCGVYFMGLPVFLKSSNKEKSDKIISTLGSPEEFCNWLDKHLSDKSKIQQVTRFLKDWVLYENGWLVVNYNDILFKFKCEIGDCAMYPPKELSYLK